MKTASHTGVASLTQFIAGIWNGWRRHESARTELACCAPSEVERIAQDLNVTSAELRTLAARDPGSADLLYRRLAAAGTNPAEIDGAVMRDLQRTCSVCNSKTECETELAEPSKAARWPSYCPNATTLAALKTCCH